MFIVGGTRRLDSLFEISNQIVKLNTNKSTLNEVKVRFFFFLKVGVFRLSFCSEMGWVVNLISTLR